GGPMERMAALMLRPSLPMRGKRASSGRPAGGGGGATRDARPLLHARSPWGGAPPRLPKVRSFRAILQVVPQFPRAPAKDLRHGGRYGTGPGGPLGEASLRDGGGADRGLRGEPDPRRHLSALPVGPSARDPGHPRAPALRRGAP